MSKYANKQFWVDTFDRAVSTFAQSLVGVLGVDVIGILDVDWVQTLSVAGLAAATSVLLSISYRGKGEEDDSPEPVEPEYEGETIQLEDEETYLGKHGITEGAQLPKNDQE